MRLSGTQKWRNVRADGRVAFVVDDLASVQPFRPRGVEIRGRAETVSEPEEVIRIRPDRVIAWGLDTDPFTTVSRRVTPR